MNKALAHPDMEETPEGTTVEEKESAPQSYSPQDDNVEMEESQDSPPTGDTPPPEINPHPEKADPQTGATRGTAPSPPRRSVLLMIRMRRLLQELLLLQ